MLDPTRPYHTVTAENVEDYDEFLQQMKANFERMVRITQKYPVEVEFKEFRFLFVTEADIREAINVLESRIAEFRSHHAPRPDQHTPA